MRHRKKGKILDRKKAARTALLRSLATSLIIYEKIKTTKAKAKAVKPMVEKIITTAKKNDLTTHRQLLAVLYHKKAVNKALEVLGPRYKERAGGYTRIINLGPRAGDGAEILAVARKRVGEGSGQVVRVNVIDADGDDEHDDDERDENVTIVFDPVHRLLAGIKRKT